jgi:hypothetical protein
MCTYTFEHGVNSGPMDIMHLEITEVTNAQVAYAFGNSYTDAVGKIDTYP